MCSYVCREERRKEGVCDSALLCLGLLGHETLVDVRHHT